MWPEDLRAEVEAQQLPDVGERVAAQPVPLRAGHERDEAGRAERDHVVVHRGLWHLEQLGELHQRLVTRAQDAEDAQPPLIAERLGEAHQAQRGRIRLGGDAFVRNRVGEDVRVAIFSRRDPRPIDEGRGRATTSRTPDRGRYSTPLVATSVKRSSGSSAARPRLASASRSRIGISLGSSSRQTDASQPSSTAMSSALVDSGPRSKTESRKVCHSAQAGSRCDAARAGRHRRRRSPGA